MESFTAANHNEVCLYKTAYYTIVLPARLALYLSGNGTASDHKQTEDVMLKIGELFQLQDDFIDCYSDPAVMGKAGTDIAESKCNWLIIWAMERASYGQKQVLSDNFGKKGDKIAEVRIKDIYKQLSIKQVYTDFETALVKEINESIVSLSTQTGLPAEMFYGALNALYKRNVRILCFPCKRC